MKIEDFNWEELYQKANDLMIEFGIYDYHIATNKGLYGNEPFVTVNFPKRKNILNAMRLNSYDACFKRKGYKKDNKLHYVFGIFVNKLEKQTRI